MGLRAGFWALDSRGISEASYFSAHPTVSSTKKAENVHSKKKDKLKTEWKIKL
jgi:hypothetical protein